MNDRGMVAVQATAALKVALRTPRTVVFAGILPLVLLVLINSILVKGGAHNETLPSGQRISLEAYFTAGIAAYAIALSTFTTLAVTLTTQRESGQLKRLRGTPMPPWTFILAQIIRATLQAVVITALMLIVGSLFYQVQIPGSTLPGFIFYVILGTATMCVLGIALTIFTPTPDAASTIAPFSVVLLAFISGVWIPVQQLPHWLESVGKLFPLYHLSLGLQTTLAPGASGSGLSASNVLALAVWAAVGAWIAARRFRWEPQASRG
jgi:ABC-2 type transport system permease protein